MRCPKCGYNSFDYLENCKKCGRELPVPTRYQGLETTLERAKQNNLAANEPTEDIIVPKETPVDPSAHSEPIKHAEPLISDEGIYYDDDTDLSELGLDDVSSNPFSELAQSGTVLGNEIENDTITAEDIHLDSEELEDRAAQDAQLDSSPNPKESSDTPVVADSAIDPFRAPTDHVQVTDETTPKPQTQPTFEQAPMFQIAQLHRRAIAIFIDVMLVLGLVLVTLYVGFYFLPDYTLNLFRIDLLFITLYGLLLFLASTYFVFMHGVGGKTIGKMVMGIWVINSDGGELGFGDAFLRWVGYYVSAVFLFMGFIWSMFDADSQTWHDKMVGTYVVRG